MSGLYVWVTSLDMLGDGFVLGRCAIGKRGLIKGLLRSWRGMKAWLRNDLSAYANVPNRRWGIEI